MINIKCTACDGHRGKREFFIGEGWGFTLCYLCDGKGNISQKVLDEENRRIALLEQVYSGSSQEYGDVLYGRGEKWGSV
jgi:hypothetical protein